LIGRTAPLAVLERSLDEALDGRPRVVLVEGEAGIGKTRLVTELLQRARRRGVLALVGRCSEGLSVPYFPLASALAPLGDDLGAGVRLLDPAAAPSAELVAASDTRLAEPLVAACRAAVRVAGRRPIVLLVEDLHWADRPTAGLFEQLVTTALLAGATSSTAFLIVATMRPPPEHLATIIERLRGESAVRWVRVLGMNEVELNELLTELGPSRPSRSLLSDMAAATQGNPLLARTVLSRLVDGGGVAVRDGELVSTVGDLLPLPGGLDAELRRRLDGVGPRCRTLLTRAAFLGDGALLADLEAVTAGSTTEFDRLLEEAEAAGVLHDDGTRYHFDHPQLRQLLYHEPGGRRRQRLHLELADDLEARYSDDPRRVVEIADHLRRAGPSVDAARLARLSLAAGEQAYAVGAWGAAARYFDSALAAAPPADVQARARLELQAGIGHFRDHDLAAAKHRLLEAVADAKTSGDIDTWGAAVLLVTRAELTIGQSSLGSGVDTAMLEELLETIDDDTPLAGQIVSLMSEIRFHAFDFDGGATLLDEARRLASRNGDDSLATSVELAAGLQHLGRLELDAAERTFRASAEHAWRLPDPWQRVWGLGRLPLVEMLRGEMAAAGAHADEAADIAAANHDWAEGALARGCSMQVATAQARFAVAEAAGADAVRMYRRSDYPFVPPLIFPAFAAARAGRGDVTGAHEAMDDWEAVGGRGLAPYRLLITASTFDRDELVAARPFRPVGGQPVNLFSLPILCAQVEVAAVLGDVKLLADAYGPLAALHRSGVRWCVGWPLLIARLLASASRLVGRLDEAARWCDVAADEASRGHAAGEAARVTLERAHLANATGDAASARALAADAASRFDQLGMMALHHVAERLVGEGAGVERVVRTMLFTDLVDSTAMNVRRGDVEYVELLDRHNAIIRRRLRQFDGVELKHTGDGMASWFASATAACECALATRDDLAEHNASNPGTPFLVRFGLASGVPIPRLNDLFGVSVSLAARLCAHAAPGQILVSEDVALASRESQLLFRPLDPFELKGFPDPVPAFDLRRRGPEIASQGDRLVVR
jgi:class 3 adenylate cyclase